jgi:hypothetical protein
MAKSIAEVQARIAEIEAAESPDYQEWIRQYRKLWIYAGWSDPELRPDLIGVPPAFLRGLEAHCEKANGPLRPHLVDSPADAPPTFRGIPVVAVEKATA